MTDSTRSLEAAPASRTPMLIGAVFGLLGGIFIGATWSLAMRKLMLGALAAYALTLMALQFAAPGNRSLWRAFLCFLAARGIGQALAYPGLKRRTFA